MVEEITLSLKEFLKEYMNYPLTYSERELLVEHIVTFVNVTSRSYVPEAKNLCKKSESLREYIRKSYMMGLTRMLPFMKEYVSLDYNESELIKLQ